MSLRTNPSTIHEQLSPSKKFYPSWYCLEIGQELLATLRVGWLFWWSDPDADAEPLPKKIFKLRMIVSHATWSPPKPFQAILNIVPKSLVIIEYSELTYSAPLLLKSPFFFVSTVRYEAEYYCRIYCIKLFVLKNVYKMWAHCAWQWGACLWWCLPTYDSVEGFDVAWEAIIRSLNIFWGKGSASASASDHQNNRPTLSVAIHMKVYNGFHVKEVGIMPKPIVKPGEVSSPLNPSAISTWTYTQWRTLHTTCQTSRLQTFVVQKSRH